MARPEPNICSQKCGKACAGAEPSITIVSAVCASAAPGNTSRSREAMIVLSIIALSVIVLSMIVLSEDDVLRETGMPMPFAAPLLKTVSGLQIATVHLGLIGIYSGIATRPA